MFFLISICILIFGLFQVAVTWRFTYDFISRDWRDSIISAILYLGVYLWGITEILSCFESLTPLAVFLSWLAYDVFFIVYFRYKKKLNKLFRIPDLSKITFCPEFLFIGFLLLVTLFIAIAYPPNNYDSLTYHLPRIEHWIQNKSIHHYFTTNFRQTAYAPFAETIILHGRILSGDDWLMNIVQWSAFLGTLIVVSKIAFRLGLSIRKQFLAGLFFATLPMAILQASSTQNDLVEAFWIACMVERFLAWRKYPSARYSIEFGIALGLAILTKGTAYAIALPFVFAFGIISLKQFRARFSTALIAGILCLTINIPHFVRNYQYFDNPIGSNSKTMSDFSAQSFVVSSLSNIYVNLSVPLPQHDKVDEALKKINKRVYPYGSPTIYSAESWVHNFGAMSPFHEDIAKNPIHMLLVIVSFLVVVFSKSDKKYYALLILFSWCVFAFFIPWQPWVTRLQVPLFAISSPLIALGFSLVSRNKILTVVVLFLCFFSLFPLFINTTRPLFSFKRFGASSRTVWNASRDELLFNSFPDDYLIYKNSCEFVSQTHVKNIGLIIGLDTSEYPIWRYLRHSMHPFPSITHQKSDSISEEVDLVFVFENKKALQNLGISDSIKIDKPILLQLNSKDNSRWDLIDYN